MAGAHQNGHIIVIQNIAKAARTRQGFDILADTARLFFGIIMAHQTQLFALCLAGPQRFAQTPLVPCDHCRSSRQNMRGGSVILFQTHHMCAGKIRLEPQDIAHFGPAPAIDRLVIIAHAADIAMRLRKQPQPQILRHIGILVFIHQNKAKAALIFGQNIGMGLENHHAMQQQIAKIHRIQGSKPLLIQIIQFRAAIIKGRCLGAGNAIRGQRAVFPAVDDPRQQTRRPAFVINIRGLDQLFHQPLLIVGVQDGEIRF